MSPEVQGILIALISSLITSSGLWAFIERRRNKNDARTRLLMNIAKGKIVRVGMDYIDAGEISRDDLEELQSDLYGPYFELGGNGLASKVMEEVLHLPLRQPPRYSRIERSREENG